MRPGNGPEALNFCKAEKAKTRDIDLVSLTCFGWVTSTLIALRNSMLLNLRSLELSWFSEAQARCAPATRHMASGCGCGLRRRSLQAWHGSR